jgi:fermentation-respiration switch protein FrsA (DUF1100 family)
MRFAAVCMLIGLIPISMHAVRLGIGFVTEGVHPPRAQITQTAAEWDIIDAEDVTLVTTDGLMLRGWYIPSQNGAAVILGHGHAGNRQAMLPYARMLVNHGYGALLFDWRAHGESDGDTVTLGDTEVQDFEAAFNYVASRPDVEEGRIGVLGLSMGASIMIEGVARNPGVRSGVFEAPYTTVEDVTRHRLGGLSVLLPLVIAIGENETGGDVDVVRPIDEICAISPRPILLIYGSEDSLISPETADEMSAAACDPKQVWIVDGGGHTDTITLMPAEYENRVIAFFDDALLGD